jgi:hypothetical protein
MNVAPRADDTGDRVGRVLALIAREPQVDDGPVGTARLLRAVCQVAARILPARAVAVTLMTERGPTGIVAALDEASEVVEELQFTVGEGPCWEAFQKRAPVLAPDVRGDAALRWPGYSAALEAHGVRAAFSFPLQVGSARLGVLDFYREQPGGLDVEALANARALARIANEMLIEGQGESGDDATPSDVERALEPSYPVFQAQGMVMARLGVPLSEAMARLQAHAYAHDRTLGSVSRAVVAHTLILESDHV